VDNHKQADTYLREEWQKYRSKYGPSKECGDNTADASFLSINTTNKRIILASLGSGRGGSSWRG
jgi:hypothetical protein